MTEWSDERVLAAVDDPGLSTADDHRLSELLNRQQAGALTDAERLELTALMEVYQIQFCGRPRRYAKLCAEGCGRPYNPKRERMDEKVRMCLRTQAGIIVVIEKRVYGKISCVSAFD